MGRHSNQWAGFHPKWAANSETGPLKFLDISERAGLYRDSYRAGPAPAPSPRPWELPLLVQVEDRNLMGVLVRLRLESLGWLVQVCWPGGGPSLETVYSGLVPSLD